MGFLGIGGHGAKPEFTGLQTQTSSSNLPIPLNYGQNRGAPNIMQQTDFKAHKHSAGGKGGGLGKGAKTYTYSGTFLLAHGWGQMTGVGNVYKDQSVTTMADLGFTFFNGATPQSPWGYMTANHSSEALGYPGIAYSAVANYDLGGSNTISQHSFELKALLWNTAPWTGGGDADIAQVIDDFLTEGTHGVGFAGAFIDTDSLFSGPNATTTGDNAAQTYWRAMTWGISPFLTSGSPAADTLKRWSDLLNFALVWTGYSLKFMPYGTDTITANGVTYLPSFPVRYTLTLKDLIAGVNEEPIRPKRSDPADSKSQYSVTISNRANQYNDLPVKWQDASKIDEFGPKPTVSLDGKEICIQAMGREAIALFAQRDTYVRNYYEVKVGQDYVLLETFDVIEIDDDVLGLLTLMIEGIDENEDDTLTLTAFEWNPSVHMSATLPTQGVAGTNINTAVAAGSVNTPIIFEPPSTLTENGNAEVWAAVSGGPGGTYDPLWGGCDVYVSTDNATFVKIGTQNEPSRMGVTTGALAAYGGANPDAIHTLGVNLAESNGDLTSASSPADAAAGSTLSYVGGELIGPQTVTLVSGNSYNLTNLYRGLYGTTPGAHLSGVPFARLDDNIFKFKLPADYIGKTLYFKFASANVYGGAAQDLSLVTAYTYTPSGAGFGTGTAGAPVAPTGLAVVGGSNNATLTWTASSANDNVLRYRVLRAPGPGGLIGAASAVGEVNALTFTDVGLAASTTYTYFLEAINAIGPSPATAGVDATTSAVGLLGAIYVPATFMPGVVQAYQAPTSFMRHKVSEPCTVRANLAGWQFGATANATSSYLFTIQKALAGAPNTFTTIGTITIAAGTMTPTFATVGGLAYTLAVGDEILTIGPGVNDATLADVHITMLLDRTG